MSRRRSQRLNEEESSTSTEPQTKSPTTSATHSYSKLRGRGRGRGQTQELKKPRKNAADFTREREEARKREEEEKKKQGEEDHFEGNTNIAIHLYGCGAKDFLVEIGICFFLWGGGGWGRVKILQSIFWLVEKIKKLRKTVRFRFIFGAVKALLVTTLISDQL